jgi:23S rRNA 5-hydroxycytidine C2501 synthase
MGAPKGTPVELLAPAKTCEAGMAAIACGADAVYIGAARFGAREAAGNRLDDIARLTAYAHTYWARVYVTLNTILFDHEIPDALALIGELSHINIDGLIIQDMGLLECDLPPIPLIASTQTHNATPAKVKFLEQVGFQRVILARELSLEQIRAIRAETSVELEVFVHGALCVGYSGQCYLSYALGGRSGNRGQCAQPCRKRYSLYDNAGRRLHDQRYLLSLKDMDRADCLEDLLNAGVTSFKIEGRLKDLPYVQNVVGYYRQKLDAALKALNLSRSSSGTTTLHFEPHPHKTFHRGRTPYFLTGRDRDMASLDTPKSIGEPVGTVLSCQERSLTLATTVELHNGDGLCFFDQQRNLHGIKVNTVQGATIVPAAMPTLEPGTSVFRNYDHAFQNALKKPAASRRIPVSITVQEIERGFQVAAIDADGVTASVAFDAAKTPARAPEAALASIRKQMAKCGDTEFTCAEVEVAWSQPYFLPVALLNDLRRTVLAGLAAARIPQRPIVRRQVRPNAVPYPETTLDYRANVVNTNAAAFYRRHGVTQIEPGAELGRDFRGQMVMRAKYCLRFQLGSCQPPHPGPWYLVDEEGHEFTLRFRCEVCDMEIWYCGIQP